MSEGEIDRRTVHTDALATIGNIIGPNEARDAVHIAVEPVIAGCTLYPADHVELKDGVAVKVKPGEGVGIVDPFLQTHVREKERFWLFVYPRQIKSLRHVWTHPKFPDVNSSESARLNSLQWLISNAPCDFQTLMESLKYHNDDEYFTIHGTDAGGEIPEGFWDHVETVTKEKFARAKYFSCTC